MMANKPITYDQIRNAIIYYGQSSPWTVEGMLPFAEWYSDELATRLLDAGFAIYEKNTVLLTERGMGIYQQLFRGEESSELRTLASE